jgi:hypothetical protein
MVFERLRALPSVRRRTKPALGRSEVRPGSDETFPSPPDRGRAADGEAHCIFAAAHLFHRIAKDASGPLALSNVPVADWRGACFSP